MLWLNAQTSVKIFEMYIWQVDIAEDQQRVKELLARLKDEPFQVDSQCGLYWRLVTTT